MNSRVLPKRLIQVPHAYGSSLGDLSPSREDREVTEKLKAAGELMAIKVLDHIVFTKKGYYSFEEGR